MSIRDRNLVLLLILGVIPVGVILYFYSLFIVEGLNHYLGLSLSLDNLLDIYSLFWFTSLLLVWKFSPAEKDEE